MVVGEEEGELVMEGIIGREVRRVCNLVVVVGEGWEEVVGVVERVGVEGVVLMVMLVVQGGRDWEKVNRLRARV